MPIKYPKLAELKSWSPATEAAITQQWQKAEQWNFNSKTRKKVYSIDTPPPYVNTPIHIGQAITYCFMDMFARHRRMKGFEVLFPLGLDRNGLPIEIAAEKKFEISPFKISREKFVEYCEKLLQESSAESIDTFAKLGISFSSYCRSREVGAVYQTDAPEYRALTQSTFISLFKKKLIYEDKRISNWDTKLRTTVADAEIEYKNLPSTFNHIIWKVKDTGEEIVIATTRPELICTCGMVIYNPADERYQHLNGKTVILPLFGREVIIREHSLAKIDKGTGLVMMCSAGDLSDIQFFREMKLQPVIAINQNGTMNEHAGFLKGLKIKEAREKVIEELKKEKLLVKQEQITHSTPVSERSGAEIEFIEMPEYYLKQLEFRDKLNEITAKVSFFPSKSKRILDSWIDSLAIDWPISRRRFYATPVPLWRASDRDKEYVALPVSGKYYQPWKEPVPSDAEVFEDGKYIGTLKEKRFSSLNWKGDERVLDTWFDSSISELVILKYGDDESFFKRAYPATLRPQGKEIVRTWLYYTLLRGYLETGKPCFKDVWIHNHIVDAFGRKMSKSLGNVINPQELLRDYGAEAIRMWAATEGDLSKQDLSCSKERIKAEVKTLTKLLNVSKFIMQFDRPKKKPELAPLDALFVDYLNNLADEVDSFYECYDFYHPALKLREFLREQFASHYIEIVKGRAYNHEKKFSVQESESARYSLYYLLELWLLLAYPIIPQITSVIANELKISFDEFPKTQKLKSEPTLVESLMSFNRIIWKAKKDKGASLREPISGIEIPDELQKFEKDLRACHGLV